MSTPSFYGDTKDFIFSHIFSIVAVLIVANLLWNKFQPGLASIPGPPIAAFTKYWRLYDVWKGHAHWTAIKLHDKYGPVVRIAPNVVQISDPEMIPGSLFQAM